MAFSRTPWVGQNKKRSDTLTHTIISVHRNKAGKSSPSRVSFLCSVLPESKIMSNILIINVLTIKHLMLTYMEYGSLYMKPRTVTKSYSIHDLQQCLGDTINSLVCRHCALTGSKY